MRKKICLLLGLLAFCLLSSAAFGEALVTWTPESPRMGDYVDVVVRPERENPQSVTYRLTLGDQKVFSGKEDDHYEVSFRPRKEGTYTLTVVLSYGKKDQEEIQVPIRVSGTAPEQAGPDIVYSQKDGWWKKKSYGSNNLEVAGCGIFTLSHAVQRLGFTEADVLPENLGKTYAFCLVEGGTANERLLTNAGNVYDFITQDELEESAAGISACLRRGDFFSFSIVNGHIALADGISEDGTKVHIVDSAPSATFERIKKGNIYLQEDDGSFRAVQSPAQLPGARYFFETRFYGGGEYWLDLDYCARRGMRLIRSSWLKLNAEGGARSVTLSQIGTMQSKVVLDEETLTVSTRDLVWNCVGAEEAQVAVVTSKSGVTFKDAAGKAIPNYKKIARGTLLMPLEIGRDTVYVFYKGSFGYVSRKAVEFLSVVQDDYSAGVLTYHGRASGTVMINVRNDAGGKAKLGELKVGTPVAVAERKEEYSLIEGKGLRGWVQNQYLTIEGEEDNGQTIDEGQ